MADLQDTDMEPPPAIPTGAVSDAINSTATGSPSDVSMSVDGSRSQNHKDRRRSSRSCSPPRLSTTADGGNGHYVPNYSSSGYQPAPRYGGRPERSRDYNERKNGGDPPRSRRLPSPMKHPYTSSLAQIPMPPETYYPRAGAGAGAGIASHSRALPPPINSYSHPIPPLGRSGQSMRPIVVSAVTKTLTELELLNHEVSFNDFRVYLRRVNPGTFLPDQDLREKYGVYRNNFIRRQLRVFFDKHKEEAWFRERYHPLEAKPRQDREIAQKQAEFAEWCAEMQDFDGEVARAWRQISLATDTVDGSELAVLPIPTKGPPKNGDGSNTLIVKCIGKNVHSQSILNRVSQEDGFVYFSISDANPTRYFNRVAWVRYRDEESFTKAMENLKTFQLGETYVPIAASTPTTTRPRYAPEHASAMVWMRKDMEMTKTMISELDRQVGVSSAAVLSDVIARAIVDGCAAALAEKGESGATYWKDTVELELSLAYLRRVHCCCLYCGFVMSNAEDAERRCPGLHRRKRLFDPTVALDPAYSKGAGWTQKMHERLNLLSKPSTELDLTAIGGSRVIEIWDHIVADGSRWGCRHCPKQFQAADFVLKHLVSKHSIGGDQDMLMGQFFNAYARDPHRPLGTEPNAGVHPSVGVLDVHGHHHVDSAIGGYPAYQQRHHSITPGAGRGGHDVYIPAYRDRTQEGASVPLSTADHHTKARTQLPADPVLKRVDPRALRSYEDIEKPADVTEEAEVELNYG